jgi:hypothetical protein
MSKWTGSNVGNDRAPIVVEAESYDEAREKIEEGERLTTRSDVDCYIRMRSKTNGI